MSKMKYEIFGSVLTINSKVEIEHVKKLREILVKFRIRQVIPKVELSYPCIFIIKKYTQTTTEGWSGSMSRIFNELQVEPPKREIAIGNLGQTKREWAGKFFNIFSFANNTWLQNKFWFEMFMQSIQVSVIDNILIMLVLFFGAGLAIAYLLYCEFLKYGIEIESCKVAIFAGLRVLAPILGCFTIVAKTSTALTSIVNKMYNQGEVKILGLMNLPYNRTFLHPLFFALVLSGPLLNLVAIYGTLAGICVTWLVHGWSWHLFLSLLKLESTKEHLLDSLLRSTCGSIVYAIATCIAGLHGKSSFDATVKSINLCVNMSAIGIIAVNAIISIITAE